jgi:hypothetical protein
MPLGRLRRRWEDNNKIYVREIDWGAMDWIQLAKNRDQWGGPCEHGNEPSGSIKYLEILG